MGKRILIVGGVAGGASAAARIRRLDADASITIFERGEHVSFSNCSLPYYLSRTVEDADYLLMMTPEGFRSSYDIEVRTAKSSSLTGNRQRSVSETGSPERNMKNPTTRLFFPPVPAQSARNPSRGYLCHTYLRSAMSTTL